MKTEVNSESGYTSLGRAQVLRTSTDYRRLRVTVE